MGNSLMSKILDSKCNNKNIQNFAPPKPEYLGLTTHVIYT